MSNKENNKRVIETILEASFIDAPKTSSAGIVPAGIKAIKVPARKLAYCDLCHNVGIKAHKKGGSTIYVTSLQGKVVNCFTLKLAKMALAGEQASYDICLQEAKTASSGLESY